MLRLPPAHLREPLNSRQRLGLLLIDEIPDRAVVYPLITSHAARIAGCPVKDYCSDGRVMAQAQLHALHYYGHDAISIFSDVGLIAEALGSKLLFRDDDVPVLQQPYLQDPARISHLILPDAEALPGRYRVYQEAIEICQREVGDVTPVLAFIPAPFTTSALLRGTEDFLMDTITDPESCHQLLNLSLQAGMNFADLCMEAGALPVLVDPLASASVISPQTFAAFARPYLKRFCDYLHRYDFDVFLHICGRSESILGIIAEIGCDLFSCDDVPLQACREKIGQRIRIVGNLRPTDLLNDDPAEIERKVSTMLRVAKSNPRGYVLATGCEVPINAPGENVKAFINEGQKMGRYWD